MLSSHEWWQVHNLQQIDCLLMYYPEAARLATDTLSRIHNQILATPVATLSLSTMELLLLGAEEWQHQAFELLIDDTQFSPIVNVINRKAKETDEASN